MQRLNTARAVDLEEKRYSNMLDDIYSYLYSNYRSVALEEDCEPVDINTFCHTLWKNIEQRKAEQMKQYKYKL